jgi:ferredoxin
MKYLADVVTLAVNAEACTGCGRCIEVCPRSVLEIRDRRVLVIDRDACMECGACARNCAFGAISVKAGVGCAEAIINGLLSGTEPTCGCSGGKGSSGCC